MQINIIYLSGTGNTEAMANYIKEGCNANFFAPVTASTMTQTIKNVKVQAYRGRRYRPVSAREPSGSG